MNFPISSCLQVLSILFFFAECKIFQENKVKTKMMPNAPNGFYTCIAPIRMMSLKSSEESKVGFFYEFDWLNWLRLWIVNPESSWVNNQCVNLWQKELLPCGPSIMDTQKPAAAVSGRFPNFFINKKKIEKKNIY